MYVCQFFFICSMGIGFYKFRMEIWALGIQIFYNEIFYSIQNDDKHDETFFLSARVLFGGLCIFADNKTNR